MYLGGTVLGLSTFENKQATPSKQAYSSITFNGNITIDRVKVIDYTMTDAEIDSYVNQDLTWDSNTLLMCNFENTLGGGNITSLSSPLTKWSINRKLQGSSVLTKLGEVAANVTSYQDYTAPAYQTYQYIIFPETDTEIGQQLVSDDVYTDFYGWYLIDPDQQIVYKLDLNFESGNIENVTDVTEFETYTKYNVYSIGQRDFVQFPITVIAGSISANGDLIQTKDYLEQFKAFINNGKTKLLKSRKGNIWKGMTIGYSQKYMDYLGEQVATVSFTFKESGDV